MIEYLKAKNHKAITSLKISELGKINVLCGRNNSGKTSIFEALSNSGSHGVGKRISRAAHLLSLFEDEALRYSNPAPSNSKAWFKEVVDQLVDTNVVWYFDEKGEIIDYLYTSMEGTPLQRFRRNGLFDFNRILDVFFSQLISSYRPLLIPPKRRLQSTIRLNFAEQMHENGDGILNRLFFLKNQDLRSVAYAKFSKIYDLFRDVTGLSFTIHPDKENNLTLFYGNDGQWLNADDCGLGLSDVLIILSLVIDTDASFIFIEEPENHLHASYQKKLLNVLKATSNRQFFLSTHSSVFLDTLSVDRVFYVQNNGQVRINDHTSKSQIIADLGYSVAENLVSDAIILTEGPTDIDALRQILRWIDLTERYNIRFWPLGGDIMQHLDMSVFSETRNVYAIVDNDPGSSKARTRFLKQCEKYEIPAIRLKRYSIENYAILPAIRSVFPRQIPSEIRQLDPMKKVDNQLGFAKKGKSIKSKIGQIFARMSIVDIKDTDLLDFVYRIDADLREQQI